MKARDIRFVKRFVLFTQVIKLNASNQLVTEQEQYHVDFGELHKVSTFNQKSENSVFIEFAPGDRFNGTATIDKSYVELMGTGAVLSNPCCNKG